jgi:zinc transporter, ZIP family
MSTAQTLLLGGIAGFTILLGLPVGRLPNSDPRIRAALCSVATGVLVFLLWDVLVHGVEPVEESLLDAVDGGSWGRFAGLALLLGGGLIAGLMSLTYYGRWMRSRRRSPLVGPGAAAVDEFDERARSRVATLSPASRLALLIATGIGLHNFGEGLAIGQSSAAGELSLAVALIVGFGLHNATEGFGIVGPMAADAERPSWRFLALLGLIGGGPTFLGTLLGQAWVNDALSVAFFAVAAGSILYVVQELFHVNRRFDSPVLTTWMVLLGLFLGYATDFVVDAAEHVS